MTTQNQSWLDLLEYSNSGSNDVVSPKKRLSTEGNVIDENCDTQEIRKRKLEIEIFDASNEKKFDNAISNKMKSPFKRRLSNEKLPEVQINTPSHQKGKRSKIDFDNKREEEEQKDEEVDELEDGEILDASIIIAKKRLRNSESSDASSGDSSSALFRNREIETDKATLERRQKQIDYGKNTAGYDNYIMEVPKALRTREHPKTPPKNLKYSRRAWEGLIKSWRRKLHAFDPKDEKIEHDDNATGF